jgi:DNA-binding CsgD family transcriptional regulator
MRGRGDILYLMEPSAALARMHLAVGEISEALRVTDEPIELAVRKGTWLWAADVVPVRVAALARAGLAADAASLAGAFSHGARGRAAPILRANRALCRAILAESRGEHTSAAALFGRAADAWQALPRPYDTLLATESQARSLLVEGQRESGLRLLLEAAEGLRRLGATGDATRTEKALGELGGKAQARAAPGASGANSRVRPARGRPSYGDRLSPREREVVRLVAEGQTNREIAETLVLSRQTVAGHLHSAMRKLRVTSRTALAVTAIETHLL